MYKGPEVRMSSVRARTGGRWGAGGGVQCDVPTFRVEQMQAQSLSLFKVLTFVSGAGFSPVVLHRRKTPAGLPPARPWAPLTPWLLNHRNLMV